MALQNTFYIVSLVYMGVSLLLILSLVTALLVIRKKVVSIEKMVKDKLDVLTGLPKRASKIVEAVKNFAKDSN